MLGLDGFAPDRIRGGKHVLDGRDACLDRIRGSPDFLENHDLHGRTRHETFLLEEAVDVVPLAPESDHDRTEYVRVPDAAAQRTAKEIHRDAGHLHPAAEPWARQEFEHMIPVRHGRHQVSSQPTRVDGMLG